MPEWFLIAISTAGGIFVIYLGITTIIAARQPVDYEVVDGGASRDIWRGALVNILSPQPWLFWFTVGSPLLIERWAVARWEAIAFVAIFVSLLVGCKLVVAWSTARGRHLVQSTGYARLMAALGLILVGFGLWLVWQGVVGLAG